MNFHDPMQDESQSNSHDISERRYDKLSAYDRAEKVLQESIASLTPRQKELLGMSEYAAHELSTAEQYDRICLRRFFHGLYSVKSKNSGMAAPASASNVHDFGNNNPYRNRREGNGI